MGRGAFAALAGTSLLAACVGPGTAPQRPGVPSDRPATTAPGATPRPYRPSNPPPRQPTASVPVVPVPAAMPAGATTARAAGVVRAPAIAGVPLDATQAAAALAAFRISCPSLVRRTDPTGLTNGADWRPACDAAAGTVPGEAVAFFRRWFEPVQVGDGRAFATGYYIPEIAGSRDARAGYAPIYARPDDLVDVDLGTFSTALAGKSIRGRVQGTKLVPYFDRTQIEEGALSGRARILGYAADPVELFFLQVQGSGNVRLPDGDVLRIGYASQNGRDYTGIGKLMRDRGLLGPGQASMQGIVDYLHAHPDEGRAIMRENKSYVFFRILDGAPLGAMGLPVSGGATVAADVKFVPLGAPVLLSMDRADANGIWIAQDTGGAIKGANRFDTFWGAGDEARAIAGGMSARGTAFVLLPVGVADRLLAAGNAPATVP
ncbi:MltA [Sphingomonas sp. Leaf412]|uniref:murein transglycosylase A n=1 Tax=Sphingomonas sp. Leaf412 TaxID=1736370 RepID=UPI0006F4CA9D|nr:murein transglycosylase A [Sphingomonas sp. Leaf412]KQT33037.1 MltA [Sphingomonas sp. Leaf412]